MPTGKPVKATRKLRQRQEKINNRRINRRKKPLTLTQMTKKSRTPQRKDMKGNNNSLNEHSSSSKKFLGEAKEYFGFGPNVNPKDPAMNDMLKDLQDGEESEEENKSDQYYEEEEEPEEEVKEIITTTKRPLLKELKKDNNKMIDEITKHQMDLQNLKNTDPEFYQHIKDNMADLLTFENDVPLDEIKNIPETIHNIQQKRIEKNMKEFDNINIPKHESQLIDMKQDISFIQDEEELKDKDANNFINNEMEIEQEEEEEENEMEIDNESNDEKKQNEYRRT